MDDYRNARGYSCLFYPQWSVSVGSGGTAVAAQIPLYAAGVAIIAVCLKIIDDNYQINTNDNYYSLRHPKIFLFYILYFLMIVNS